MTQRTAYEAIGRNISISVGVVLLLAGAGLSSHVQEFESASGTNDFIEYTGQWEGASCVNNAFAMNDVAAQPTGTANNAVRLVGQGFCDYNMSDMEQEVGTYQFYLRLHRADCNPTISAIQILYGRDSNTGQFYRFFDSPGYGGLTIAQDTSQLSQSPPLCPFVTTLSHTVIRDWDPPLDVIHISNPLAAVPSPYTADTDIILDAFTISVVS